MADATSSDRERVRALIALATHAKTPETEASAAALEAVRRIAKFDLLSLEALRAAKIDAVDAQNIAREERQRAEAGPPENLVRIDVILLVMSESAGAYRFARLPPNFKQSGSPCIGWIRKNLIAKVVWASPEVAKIYSAAGRRVVEALLVPSGAASSVRAIVMGPSR